MAPTIIDLNDANISIYQNGKIICECPGIAHVSDRGLLFGNDAVAVSRYEPQGLADKFWTQLDFVALVKRQKSLRHHADYAYRQLASLSEEFGPFTDIIFIIPSDYNRGNLQVLLGIAQSLELKVLCFVDRAVASIASTETANQRVQYLDLSLHRTSITQLDLTTRVAYDGSQTLERIGQCYFDELTINWIADSFLDQARFDPLEHAATEQILFNQLNVWLIELAQSAHINVGLDFHGRRHEVSLAKVDLLNRFKPSVSTIAAALRDNVNVFLSAQFARYPGELFSAINATVIDKLSMFDSVSKNLPAFRGDDDQVRLIRSLEASNNQTLSAVAASDGP
ncbi:MAG: hypothetical protein ACU84Q_11310 [Gammaproteobacteria bacterium]